jgi:diguanylate cyclase (GGDEF)-like protein
MLGALFVGATVISDGARRLVRSIAKHPWSSLRDFVVLGAIMVFAVLLARQYDLFAFVEMLADPRREISLPEAAMLACMGAVCIAVFVARRLKEGRSDAVDSGLLAAEMQALRELALQDPLTGLPNRRMLLDALEAAVKLQPHEGRSHAVFLLDLNGFKRVNDHYGHAVGDEVLRAVVGRFRRAARAGDVLAQLGGDEFAVLSRDVDVESAHAIGDRFIAALGSHVKAGEATHALGVAIGAALFPNDGDTVEKILRHADVAMYRAKASEHSALVFFAAVAAEGGTIKASA